MKQQRKPTPQELLDQDEWSNADPMGVLSDTVLGMVKQALHRAHVAGFQSGFTEGRKHGLEWAARMVRKKSPEDQEECWQGFASLYGFDLAEIQKEEG